MSFVLEVFFRAESVVRRRACLAKHNERWNLERIKAEGAKSCKIYAMSNASRVAVLATIRKQRILDELAHVEPSCLHLGAAEQGPCDAEAGGRQPKTTVARPLIELWLEP